MSWSKKRLKEAKLYLILDTEACLPDRQVLLYKELLLVLKAVVRFGVDIVQLRSKNGSAKDILAFCQQAKPIIKNKALFILNDRIDLALLAGVDGVHLGQEDVPYAQARDLMGRSAIIGISCQNLKHAQLAQAQGADYIGFGSVYKTKTKPERQPMNLQLLKSVIETIKIPVFAIGGICQENVDQLTKLGVTRVAVCRDILLAKDLKRKVGSFKTILRG